MIQFIIVLYIVAQSVSMAFTIPQLKKLYEVKDSNGFSLRSYIVWTFSQVVNFIYASYHQQYLWALACSVWVAYQILMVYLIIKFRPTATPQPVTELSNENNTI